MLNEEWASEVAACERRRKLETRCSCCSAEFSTMFKGTDGTVYCGPCSLRGGRLVIGCLTCNNEPPIVTRRFRVTVP